MGLPKISIIFKSVGITAIKRSENTVLALLVVDDNVGHYTINSPVDISEDFEEGTQKVIQRALIGGISTPKRVEVVAIATADKLKDGLKQLEQISYDYLAIYGEGLENDEVLTWAKNLNENTHKKFITVLDNTKAEYDQIVNFTNKEIHTKGKVYNTKEYTSRIAGLLAGTPLTIATTYQVLPEVIDVDRYDSKELDEKIDKGEFILFHDGEKVKVGRGVNSFTEYTQDKGEQFGKIKVRAILNLIYKDIVKTAEDNYIGKYANSYDNKVLLVTAINGYLRLLELDGLLDEGKNRVYIDVERQKAYLESKGEDTSNMSIQEIKEANTDDKVFLAGDLKPLDAIEEITVNFSL